MSSIEPGVRISGAADAGPASIGVTEPATGETLSSIAGGGVAEATTAVAVAVDAGKDWAKTVAPERADALLAIADDLIRASDSGFSGLLARESGKLLAEARGEIEVAASYFRWFAAVTRTDPDFEWRARPGVRHKVISRPKGVVAVLTPWNFPVSIPARKIAPALAAGCSIVFRPSLDGALAGLRLAEILDRHLPPGVVNTVVGPVGDVVDTWLADERVNGVSFTGSTTVGRQLAQTGGSRLMDTTLELGGHAPFIILEDASVESAVADLVVAKFRNNGQSCIAANHVWVASNLWDEVTSAFCQHIAKMRVGDPLDPETDLGPLRKRTSVDRLQTLIEEARVGGATIVATDVDTPNYFYMAPTAVLDPQVDSRIWNEEIFGPVAPFRRFDDIDEVFEDSIGDEMGLAAYFATSNPARGVRLSQKIECGLIGVNVPSPTTPQFPFGGLKASGYGGYEGGRLGIEPFRDLTTIAVADDDD